MQRREKAGIKYRKDEIGITLIALVVTIVVLLILAGITINMLFSNGGIFKTAGDAANAWNQAVINEQADLDNLTEQIQNLVNGQVGGGTTPGEEENIDPETGWDLNKVTKFPSKDEPSVNVPVPNGFTASTVEEEQKVEEGFVIKQDGTNNEFVWIPVSAERLAQMYTEETVALSGGTGVTTSIYSKSSIYTMDKPGTTGHREPDLVVGSEGTDYDASSEYQTIVGASDTEDFAQKMVDEYKEIHGSIEQYGGFYIGRYELTGDINSPTVAKGGTVITDQNWYNLKAACTKIINNSGKQESEIIAKTTMIYGNQWDEVCNWLSGAGYDIENSTSWGNYSDNTEEGAGTKQTAGYKESWQANNIYDFAGNCAEWTQEALDTSNRVIRGGFCNISGSDNPASDRNYSNPYLDYSSILSTRPTLYIM